MITLGELRALRCGDAIRFRVNAGAPWQTGVFEQLQRVAIPPRGSGVVAIVTDDNDRATHRVDALENIKRAGGTP